MVFEVSRDGNVSYLAGTIHLLRAQDYPLPREFLHAYERADSIVLETDLSAIGQQQAGKSLLSSFQLEQGVTAKSLLDPDVWQALVNASSRFGLPIEIYADKHPAFMSLTLFRLAAEQKGIIAGVDAHFFQAAQKDQKTIRHLESVEDQLESLSSLMSADPNEMVRSTLRELDDLAGVFEKVVMSWEAGDTDGLAETMLQPLLDESPEVYQSLMVERNALWMPQIEAMVANPELELILVGSAHLLGKDGLIRQLGMAGYDVEFLEF